MKFFLVASASCHLAQTNIENARICSEDTLLFFKIRSLHLLLEVDDHDVEEYSVVLALDNRWANSLVAQYQSKIFHILILIGVALAF